MIVRDEGLTLGRLLDVVKPYVNEIIIIDTGSIDDTKEISLKYTDKVYDYVWDDDFASPRNYSYELATSDYIMWLDGHDVVTPEFMENIITLLESTPDGIISPYNTSFDVSGEPLVIVNRMRVIKKATGWKWLGLIHECISYTANSNIIHGEIAIEHRPVIKPAGSPRPDYLVLLQRNVVECPTDARAYYYLAREYYMKGDYQKCIPVFEQCVELSQGGGFYHDQKFWSQNYIGRAYKDLAQYDDAERETLKSIEIGPEWPEGYFLMGEINYFKRQWNLAIHWFLQARTTPEPVSDFIKDKSIYTYAASRYLPYCYAQLKEWEAGLAEAFFAHHYLPGDKMVEQNMDFFVNKVKKSCRRSVKSILVSIVIPTYNNIETLTNAIQSIYDNTDQKFEIIVINNGDPIDKNLFANYSAQIYNAGGNKGWAGGVNLGAANATGEYVLMLNDDILILPNDRLWLTKLVEILVNDEEVGIVAPASNYASGYQNMFWKGLPEVLESNYYIGFCALINRKYFSDMEFLDEKILPDDIDLAIRINKDNKKIIVRRDVFVWHFGCQTGYKLYGDPSVEDGWNSPGMIEKNKKSIDEKHGDGTWEALYQKQAQLYEREL
jgi:glycosyltransferase involved in cell wall biosynthesis